MMELNSKITGLDTWNLGLEKHLIIAGPCSAETREQMLSTAEQLRQTKVKIFRAGIWKPRTRPDSFEGVGSKGLEWLREVKEKYGFYTATEVANVKHVYECLRSGIDMLWIGSRTTVNPFAVQEIADSLKGVDIPVLIKNPINPDIDLWIGSIERLLNAGITRIGAIHRGVSLYEKTKFRNPPCWELPIELKRRLPSLPVICDPSHICGTTELIPEISQKAIDLDFDGLMIETHHDPSVAWSDAKQQLNPKDLLSMIDHLYLRKSNAGDQTTQTTLEDLRRNIDRLDKEFLYILGERLKISEAIGLHKKSNNITVLQTGRWEEIVNNRINEGGKLNLSPELIMNIFKAIHIESINKQSEIMSK